MTELEQAILDERRACAKLARDEVTDMIDGPARETGLTIAAAIEARESPARVPADTDTWMSQPRNDKEKGR